MSSDLIIKQETLGERIRRLRKERNLSQTALANSVQVTFGWISQIEQDKANASPDVLNKIASALKIPIHVLLQGEDEHMEIVSRIKLVEVLLETNQPKEAVTILNALEGHPELSESDRLTLQLHRAEGIYQQKNYDDVLSILKPLIRRLETSNYHDVSILARILNLIGNANYQKRNFTDALYSYRKAYDYTKRFEYIDSLAAKITYNVGITLRMKGIIHESIKYLEESHQFFERNQDLKTLGFTLYEKGISYINAKEYTNASTCFEESKAIFHSLNIKNMYEFLRFTVASEITLHEDPCLAFDQLNDCLKAIREENLTKREVLIQTKIAHVLAQMGEYDRAAQTFFAVEVLIEKDQLQKTAEAAEFEKTYAHYYMKCGEYEKVFKHALAASAIFGKMGLAMDQMVSLQEVANAYEAIGNYRKALYYEREYKKIALEVRRS